MKFNKQLFNHNPEEGVYGDCHRTAIACILDLEPSEVPAAGPEEFSSDAKFHEFFRKWLHTRGLNYFEVAIVGDLMTILSNMELLNPDIYWILGGTSQNGTGHSVVCKGGRIIWDPSQTNSGISGPLHGVYWIGTITPFYETKANTNEVAYS